MLRLSKIMTRSRIMLMVEGLIVVCIVSGLFLFTLHMSSLPVGDDPGYHSMVLRQLLQTNDFHFANPFFPSLNQHWSSERFVTPVLLWVVGKIVGHVDVLAWPRIFAALCMASSLIPFYWLVRRISARPVIAVCSMIFLAFSKFYQENFWEGSYEQYTGLFLFMLALCFMYRLHESRKPRYLFYTLGLLIVLFKTHELGFLVTLSMFGVASIWYLYQIIPKKIFWTSILILGMVAIWLLPRFTSGYALNNVDYPIIQMLGVGEGIVRIAFALSVFGFLIALIKKLWAIIVLTAITIIYSQSFYLGVPFYAYRFNMYFMVAVALCIAIGFEWLVSAVGKTHPFRRIIEIVLAAVFLVSIIIPQIHYSYGLWSWISSQTRNPASVILQSDIAAMHWIESSTLTTDVFIAPMKWGYYLPAISGRSVILTDAVGGDARDARYSLAQLANSVFVETNSIVAADLMHELGAKYVYYSSSIRRFPERFPGYRHKQFEGNQYFKTVYNKDGVTIYELL